MAAKSRILVIGPTGYIGKHIVLASARHGHPTFALVRETAAAAVDLTPAQAKLFEDLEAAGVTLVHGDLYDHASLVRAVNQVDVVISTVGFSQLKDQTKIIDAIKDSGADIKRFLPSEFGVDVDRGHFVEPVKSMLDIKVQIRRAVEASGIPYTFVVSNCFAGYFLPTLAQAEATGLPTDKVIILGDGNVKAMFVDEDDVGTYTLRAVDDPRTLNKVLYMKPPANILSHNELVSLWEKKVGKTFERVYVSEEEILKKIQVSPVTLSLSYAIYHSVFINGDHTSIEIEPSFGVEASELYPDVKYISVDEYLNHYL
ncbi:eugenol synthase 1-like [Zingiber officinale]|uniref:eugenol synthase 1-like n=1 Tax=Zingiber officinale TaxID=94328 RepID=UPI001C4C3748|nr:eugenol synthase 1-like [Zingiber officinale]